MLAAALGLLPCSALAVVGADGGAWVWEGWRGPRGEVIPGTCAAGVLPAYIETHTAGWSEGGGAGECALQHTHTHTQTHTHTGTHIHTGTQGWC